MDYPTFGELVTGIYYRLLGDSEPIWTFLIRLTGIGIFMLIITASILPVLEGKDNYTAEDFVMTILAVIVALCVIYPQFIFVFILTIFAFLFFFSLPF
jgi:hypothetical protein